MPLIITGGGFSEERPCCGPYPEKSRSVLVCVTRGKLLHHVILLCEEGVRSMAIHAEDLRRFLAQATGRVVYLRINDNLHSLINARRDSTGLGIRVSLHRMFLEADQAVINALALFVSAPTPDARRIIREFINRNRERIVQARAIAPRRAVRGTALGRRFDLQERADALNAEHFKGALNFRIIWGRPARGGKGQRHVTLGTWNERQRIIRIHPMLDQDNVPAFFLDYIIYHEMVHIAVPSQVQDSGRLHHHTEDFYALERSYPRYVEARAWEQRWLPRLIRAWNGGTALPAAADPEGASALSPSSLHKPEPSSHPPTPPAGSPDLQLEMF